MMKYFRNVNTNSIYRTQEITFNDGTPSLRVERWNWDFDNWNGNIHNHEKTRKQLKELTEVISITEQEVLERTS